MIRGKRILLLQLLFVTLAFVLMVVTSSLYVRSMLQNTLNKEALDKLNEVKLKIETELFEPRTTLAIVATTIRNIIVMGNSTETIQAYMTDVGAELQKKTAGYPLSGVFGYFEAFGDLYLHSDSRKREVNFDPSGLPWYMAAIEAGDKAAVTPMYYSFQINDFLITYVRRIYDNEGQPLGIICMDVPLDHLRSDVVNMRITDSGYGVLMNELVNIIAHPNSELIGKPARQISPGFSLLSYDIEMGRELFEREFENYLGIWTVTFTLRLDNNWILTLMTPKAEYYRGMRTMLLINGILGAFFAVILLVILIRIDLAKNKADELNRQKSVLLTYMEKIREADEHTQILLNATPLGCKLWDKNINIIECNQELLNLFEIKDKQTLYDVFFQLSPEHQPNGKPSKELAFEYINDAFKVGRCRFEWMHQKLNGEEIPSEITLVRIEHKGEYVVAGYIRDLREYKKMMQNIDNAQAQLESALKEAQEANMAKSRFLANMSHEIRTPMNVIIGVAEGQLLDDKCPPEISESFEKIFDAGNLLLHIINDILDLSKIEAGKLELNPMNYEALSLINDAANMNIMQIERKHLDFILFVDEIIPQHLFGDELRIKQILNNLLSNSFKYTNSGEVKLSFTAEDTGEKETVLVIKVQDTGQGMTPEQVKRLFDEYTRFNIDTNRATIGTGLGMAITNNLIKMMNGSISVESSPGKGSLFTVRIPQGINAPGLLGREAAENLHNFNFTKTERERHTRVVREPMPYGKVLVVDDMKPNLNVAKLLLNPYKLQIDTAESGLETLNLINNGKVYDIIFMDHMMPFMDGIETTKRLRENGYNNTIVALTANALAGQKDLFLNNGFDDYISKPIDTRQLNSLLNKLIRDKEREKHKDPDFPSGEIADDTETESPESSDIPEIIIPGVDTERGLELYEGETDVYVSVLRYYVTNAYELIDKLRNVTLETLEQYTIDVHGLKGICASIGAEAVRADALKLEMTARTGDLEGVLARNDALLAETAKLTTDIEAWLANLDKQSVKPRLARPDSALLSRLKKCCEAYDMKGVDEIMDEMESYDYDEEASLITWLREKIDSSDFPAVASRLSAYKEEDK